MARNRRESPKKHSSFNAYLESIKNDEREQKLEVIEKLINGFGERLLVAVTKKKLTIFDSKHASAISKEIGELKSKFEEFQKKRLELIELKKNKDIPPEGNRKYLNGVDAILQMYRQIKDDTESINKKIEDDESFKDDETRTFRTFFGDITQSFTEGSLLYSGDSFPFFIPKSQSIQATTSTPTPKTHLETIITRFNDLVSNMEYGNPISKFFNYAFSTLYIIPYAIRRAFLALSWNLYDELKKIDFSSEDTQQSILATIIVGIIGIIRTILKPFIFLALICSGLTSVIFMAAEAVSFAFYKIASGTPKFLSNAFGWLINFFIGDRTLVSESSDANSKIQPDKDLIEELTGSKKEELFEVYRNSTYALKEQMKGILERDAEVGIDMLDEIIKQYRAESKIVYTGLIRDVTALKNCITPAQELKKAISPSSLKPEELILKATAIEEKIKKLEATINALDRPMNQDNPDRAMKQDKPEYLTQICGELKILIENARKSKSLIEDAIKVQSLISIPPLLQSERQELSAIDIALEHEKRAKEMEDALNNLQEAAKKDDIPWAKSLLLQLNKEVETVILTSRSYAYAAAIKAKTAAIEAETAASAVFKATSIKLSDYRAVNNGLIEDNTIVGFIVETLERTLVEADKQIKASRGEAEQAQEVLKKIQVSDSKFDIDVSEVCDMFANTNTIDDFIAETQRRDQLEKKTEEHGNTVPKMEPFKTAISSGRAERIPNIEGVPQTAFTTSRRKRTIPESPFQKMVQAAEAFANHKPVDYGTSTDDDQPPPTTKHGL